MQRNSTTARPQNSTSDTGNSVQADLPDATLKQLTHEAIGEDGSTDSFVILLLAITKAIKEERYLDADNMLFHSIQHAYKNSGHYVEDLMAYHDKMKRRMSALAEG